MGPMGPMETHGSQHPSFLESRPWEAPDLRNVGLSKVGFALPSSFFFYKCSKRDKKSLWGELLATFSTFGEGVGQFFDTFLKAFGRLRKRCKVSFLNTFPRFAKL